MSSLSNSLSLSRQLSCFHRWRTDVSGSQSLWYSAICCNWHYRNKILCISFLWSAMINCHKLRGLKTLFSCIMKIRSLKLRSWLGYFLYGGFKGNRPLTFFSFQRLPHILTNNPIHQSAQSLASLLLTLILILLLHSQETLVITLVQVIQDNRKVINLIISAKCLLPHTVKYSQIPGIGTWTCWGIIQTSVVPF